MPGLRGIRLRPTRHHLPAEAQARPLVASGPRGRPQGWGFRVRLKAFFSYFGAKVSMAGRYPAPEHPVIVEPFAGSAGYACSYPEREILLYDKSPVIVGVWEFLIRATPGDILALPLDPAAASGLSQAERDFIGFWWGRCGAQPYKSPAPWMRSGRFPYSFWGEKTRARIAGQVERIKHWRVATASYEDIPNRPATWFIDPPYQARGKRYPYGSAQMDYACLAAWVQSREGQVIACESDEAAYLPFRSAYALSTIKYRRQARTVQELVYARPGVASSPQGDATGQV